MSIEQVAPLAEKTLSTRCTADERAQIEAEAAEYGVTPSALVYARVFGLPVKRRSRAPRSRSVTRPADDDLWSKTG